MLADLDFYNKAIFINPASLLDLVCDAARDRHYVSPALWTIHSFGLGITMAEKPSVLIIGGLGYIGRFLALHIQKNNLASEVRIVDKVLPQLAWLAPEFEEACSKEKFMQADASKERMCGPVVRRILLGR